MIVQEYKTEAGVHIAICDDAYRDASPEEIRARIRQARQTAWWCAMRAEERKLQEARTA